MESANEPSNRQLRKAIYSLALPIVWSNLLQRGVGIVDAMLVGHLGAAELAAVGMAQLVVFLASALIMGIGIGTMIPVARSTGAGRPDEVNEAAGTGVIMGFIASILLSIVSYILSYKAAIFMGATPDVAKLAEDYLHIIFIFLFARSLIYIISSIFQGTGDSKTPLQVIIWVNIVHIIMAYPLIYGFNYEPLLIHIPAIGVRGAAWANGLSELGGIIVLYILAVKKGLLRPFSIKINLSQFKNISKLGYPVFFERLLITSSQMVYAGIVVSFSVAAYAAHQIGFNIEALAFLPGLGFAQAATAMVGQSLGAQNPARAKRVGYQSNFIALGIMILFGISYLVIPRFWVGLFTNDPEVAAYGVIFCYIAAFIQAPLASAMVFAGALRGAGQTRFVMYTTIIGAWGIRLPFAYIFGIWAGGGIIWVWIAMLADWVARSTILLGRYKWGRHFD
jgi:putative MATE family efflux protein